MAKRYKIRPIKPPKRLTRANRRKSLKPPARRKPPSFGDLWQKIRQTDEEKHPLSLPAVDIEEIRDDYGRYAEEVRQIQEHVSATFSEYRPEGMQIETAFEEMTPARTVSDVEAVETQPISLPQISEETIQPISTVAEIAEQEIQSLPTIEVDMQRVEEIRTPEIAIEEIPQTRLSLETDSVQLQPPSGIDVQEIRLPEPSAIETELIELPPQKQEEITFEEIEPIRQAAIEEYRPPPREPLFTEQEEPYQPAPFRLEEIFLTPTMEYPIRNIPVEEIDPRNLEALTTFSQSRLRLLRMNSIRWTSRQRNLSYGLI